MFGSGKRRTPCPVPDDWPDGTSLPGRVAFASRRSDGARLGARPGARLLFLVLVLALLLAGCSSPESAEGGSPDSPKLAGAAEAEPTTVYQTTVPQPQTTAASPEPAVTGAEGREANQGTPAFASSGEELSITFLDVGQGSGILLRLPNDGNILIDGGPREQGDEVVTDLGRFGVDTLDAVVASHADEDHAGGLIDVIGSMPVSTVYDSGYPHTTETYNDFLDAIERSGARYVETRTGEEIELDPEVQMQFVYPDDLGEGTNESTLALRLSYGAFAAQFTGDLGEEEEEELLASGRLSPVTLMEVGHHGSAGSSSAEFLEALSPEGSGGAGRRGQLLRPPYRGSSFAGKGSRGRGLPDRRAGRGHGYDRRRLLPGRDGEFECCGAAGAGGRSGVFSGAAAIAGGLSGASYCYRA